jgi:hypothetical protein
MMMSSTMVNIEVDGTTSEYPSQAAFNNVFFCWSVDIYCGYNTGGTNA